MEILKKILNLLNLLFSISAIGTLIWYHGYQYQPDHLHPHLLYMNICYSFYFIQFTLRAKGSGDYKNYLRKNQLEYYLFFLLFLELIMNSLIDFSIISLLLSYSGIANTNHVYVLSLHIILLLIAGIELGKATSRSTIWKLSPPILFILSFVVLIVVGSSLLMLPEMTTDKQGMSFINALFTSISANCVTGLIVVDTATYFTIKGKLLILLLIQLGGLNIITFATYFISFLRRKIKSMHVLSIKELLHTDSLQNTKKMVKMVILTSLIIEFIGAIVIYHQWTPDIGFANNQEKLFYSFFHAISAFNNAGFSLFTNGFTNTNVNTLYSIHITITVLIILGGLGFTTLHDTFNLNNLRREKSKIPLQSKIALYSSIALITIGAIIFYVFENNNTLSELNTIERIITSFFQSVTTRTAGFNSVDFGNVTVVVIVTTLLLMFIGASSGSTGGGIKTSTFVVLALAFLKRNEKKENYGNSFLTTVLVNKAFAILFYSIAIITVGVIILYLSEGDKNFVDLLFEEISAFGTVGLSTGITSQLSNIGKSVIMASMFIGRIGPLALAYALIKTARIDDDKKEQGIMIG